MLSYGSLVFFMCSDFGQSVHLNQSAQVSKPLYGLQCKSMNWFQQKDARRAAQVVITPSSIYFFLLEVAPRSYTLQWTDDLHCVVDVNFCTLTTVYFIL